ncbi:MAG: ACT domain-containing protein, partial [Tabrizicola sp.]|nr:ACT domain-containing protein [Tabrizicola sp.]
VGVAAKMFAALAAENVNIKVITTSEIKISVLIDRKYMELAVQALHDTFGLEKA